MKRRDSGVLLERDELAPESVDISLKIGERAIVFERVAGDLSGDRGALGFEPAAGVIAKMSVAREPGAVRWMKRSIFMSSGAVTRTMQSKRERQPPCRRVLRREDERGLDDDDRVRLRARDLGDLLRLCGDDRRVNDRVELFDAWVLRVEGERARVRGG